MEMKRVRGKGIEREEDLGREKSTILPLWWFMLIIYNIYIYIYVIG